VLAALLVELALELTNTNFKKISECRNGGAWRVYSQRTPVKTGVLCVLPSPLVP
jgi:hypothetical protein